MGALIRSEFYKGRKRFYVGQSKLGMAYAENYFSKLPKDALEWKVLDDYRAKGVQLKPMIFPDSGVYDFDLVNIVLTAESGAAFDELTRTDRDTLAERQDRNFWPNIFRTSRFIPAVEYINANRYRSQLCQTVQAFMKNYDVVLVPTFAGNQLSITNLTGNPVVCMPMGFRENGTPLSITLIGNLYDEASILKAVRAYQDKTNHHKKHPPKFSGQL
jgi:Asp-tRNA(Asn)/Glu-tRNA(Gln) amidotransferase A subunit family amidase